MTPGEVTIVAVPIIVGFVLSMLITWTPRPVSVTTRWLASASVLVVALTISVALASARLDDGPPDAPDGATPADAGSVADLAPDLVDRLVLSTDDSTGSPVLFSSRLTGGDRERLSDELGGPVEPVPGSTRVVAAWDGALEIREVTGEPVRRLTDPPDGHDDSSPALAADAGVVYFVRSRMRDLGGGTWDTLDGWVMRVPLDGSAPATRVDLDRRLYTVSVDDSGAVLAGTCDDPANVGQACVGTGGALRFVPGSEGTTMTDVQVSPDGSRIAYASFRASPYGGAQIYAYERGSGTTTNMSRMAGDSAQPSWARGAARPCLLFGNDPSGTDAAVHLSCLTPQPRTVPVLPVGRYPRWLRP